MVVQESAQILNNRDKARTRINVYHDSANNWLNIIKELIGNSLDVFDHNSLHHISLSIINSKTIEYVDDGIGIPVEVLSSDGTPNYIALFEIDFAGTKYGYTNTTVGQNGVFLWTLAMTCQDINFEIARPDGNIYSISYHEGNRVGDLMVVGKSTKTYSKIKFEIDDKVWSNPQFTYEAILEIVHAQASLAPNVVFLLNDLVLRREETIQYPNGIVDYFNVNIANKKMVSRSIQLKKTTLEKTSKIIDGISCVVNDEISVDMILGYSNDSEHDFKKDFLNTANLIKYGTINEGILYGLKASINKWLKTNGKYSKNEKQITIADIETGLNYVCDVRSYYVEYVGQSKQRTESPHYKSAISKVVEEAMSIYFIENKDEAEKIGNQVLLNKRVREKSD